MRLLFQSLALTTSILSFSAHAADLSPTEEKIVASIQTQSNYSLNLLEKSVNINSGTMNAAGVRDVGALFRSELDQLGFKTRWAEMPESMQRAGHLIAEHDGSQGKRILLIGHLDTVFEKDSSVPLWVKKEGKIWGQGVVDMKGGDVVIIGALRALKEVGVLDNTRIRVIFNGDEEQPGSPLDVARADLINAAKQSDVALAFESMMQDEKGHDTATVGRRAIGGFSLTVTGKQNHSAGIFGVGGFGAIYETARILNSFREKLIEPNLTFNVGSIIGGTETNYDEQTKKGWAFGKTNVIPKIAHAEGDIRYLSHRQRDKTYAAMRKIVGQHLPETNAEISFRETYPPMPPTHGNMKLLALYSQASKDANLGELSAIPPSLRGAGDIQFAAPYADSLDGLGAAGGGDHSPDEFIETASIERATIRAALVIYRLTR